MYGQPIRVEQGWLIYQEGPRQLRFRVEPDAGRRRSVAGGQGLLETWRPRAQPTQHKSEVLSVLGKPEHGSPARSQPTPDLLQDRRVGLQRWPRNPLRLPGLLAVQPVQHLPG